MKKTQTPLPEEIVQIIRESNYSYKVLNTVNGVEGFVWLSERRLGDFKEGSLLWKVLEGLFHEDTKVIDMDMFAPHGENEPDPAFSNIGIGTYVLNRVLEDITRAGNLIIYSHEPSQSAYGLLMKNRFHELNDGKQREVFGILKKYSNNLERKAA